MGGERILLTVIRVILITFSIWFLKMFKTEMITTDTTLISFVVLIKNKIKHANVTLAATGRLN